MEWIDAAKRLRTVAGEDWLPSRLRRRMLSFERLYAACSGGADSVFLTIFFAAMMKAEARELVVLHFNHKLRGEDSDEDERFTRELCRSLQLPCVSDAWIRSNADDAVSEDGAREARMSFFAKAVGQDATNAIILTGHHADDIAETMLMRLSRGSGLQGLSAPREESQGDGGLRFLRPLLSLRKRWIVSCLKQARIPWREDESNATEQFYRNRLRATVIPEWEKASDREPQVGAALSRTLLEEDWRALEAFFKSSWGEIVNEDGSLNWRRLTAMPRALQRRALNRLVSEEAQATLTLPALDGVLDALEEGQGFKVSVSERVWLSGSAEVGIIRLENLAVTATWSPRSIPYGAVVSFPDGSRIEVETVEVDSELNKAIRSGNISHDKCVYLSIGEKHSAPLWVKLWRPGDAYRPLGRKKDVKLKELFIDRKIPKKRRRTLPVLTNEEGAILWTPGLPPSDGWQIHENTTRALQLTYTDSGAP